MINNKITMIEIFAGIGAQERAIRQLPMESEIVATMDIDKDAILSYVAMRYDFEKELSTYNFPQKEQMVNELQQKNVGFDFQKNKHTITMKTNENKVKQYYLADKLAKNLGDVSLCEKLPYSDIIFHSSPCQDYSSAGKGAGGDEGSGTRSSLMFESLRLIRTSKPKYVIWENVSAVLSLKHRHNFIRMLEKLSEMGYESTFDLLNSKHFGVPQNRLRIFCISHLIDNNKVSYNTPHQSTNKQVNDVMTEISTNDKIKIWNDFIWPEEIPLTTRLKDILEHNVDEKYYLPDDRIEKILNSSFMQEKKRIQTTNVCDTLLARDWKDPKCVIVDGIQLKDQGKTFDGFTDISGTLMARDYKGFGNQSMTGVIEVEPQVRKIGQASTDGSQCGTVYSTDDLAPTLIAGCHGYAMGYIAEEQEPFIVASRGRNPENPSDRTVRIKTEQRLEPNREGICNCITSVQKDSYVVEPIIYDDYNNRIPDNQDIITTLTTNCGAAAPRNGVKIIEPIVCEERKDEGLRFFKDEVVGTLRTIDACGDKRVIEPKENVKCRIRKLTCKECWRLMNFTDEDNNRVAQYISNSAQYKQAGNSIVVGVLIAIFSSLFIKDGYKADVWTKYILHYWD